MSPSSLTCKELVELVTEYLEGGLQPDERLAFERHVAICPPCRGYFSQLRRIARTAGSLREEHVPAALRDDLLNAFLTWNSDRKDR